MLAELVCAFYAYCFLLSVFSILSERLAGMNVSKMTCFVCRVGC